MGWQTGQAVRYAPGVMRKVALHRHITPQGCMVAYTHAKNRDMGRLWLTVEGVKTRIRKRCLVVDLPQTKHKPNLIKRGILVELDWGSSSICPPHWSGAARECAVKVSR
jgi:hypothetical protein